MKVKSWIGTGVVLGLLVVTGNAADLQIDPAKIENAGNIPSWEVFKYVKDGSVSLENAGDDKALKLSTEADKKGLMLIARETVKCNKGEKIIFSFTAKGKGALAGGAYLFDADGEKLGGVYGALKDIKSDDEWTDFLDTKDIPATSEGKHVASIQPYLSIKQGSEVSLKSLNYKISSK